MVHGKGDHHQTALFQRTNSHSQILMQLVVDYLYGLQPYTKTFRLLKGIARLDEMELSHTDYIRCVARRVIFSRDHQTTNSPFDCDDHEFPRHGLSFTMKNPQG